MNLFEFDREPVVTDDQGVFVIEGLIEGTYECSLSHEHYYLERGLPRVKVPVADGEVLEIAMKPGGKLMGSVRNLASRWQEDADFRVELTLMRDERPSSRESPTAGGKGRRRGYGATASWVHPESNPVRD